MFHIVKNTEQNELNFRRMKVIMLNSFLTWMLPLLLVDD
jgi:hypothetical protein